MPSHYAVGRDGYPRNRPWKARVMVKGRHYFVGYYETKEEAKIMEDEFRNGYVGNGNRFTGSRKVDAAK